MPRLNNGKLHIAMLGHKRIPSREGGVEIVVSKLATRMVSLGHNVTCYNRRGHHVSGAVFDSAELKEYNGISLKSVWTINKPGVAAMTSSFFAALAAAFGKYDVVHFHAEGPCAMIWLPKLFGKKCIATIHGLDYKRSKWGGFASKYILFGEKCAVRFADEIIVLSENVQNYFTETYGRKTVFIPNGITYSENVEADEITKKYGIKKDDYILFLGRLVPEKGIQYLIEAFKQLNTEKKLVISGGSSDTDDFQQKLKEMADGKNIIFTDFVHGRELEELYSNAYLYVLPSDLEGMPLSLLEAMSYGNCCLTSDIPECTEVLGDYGFTFKKSNVDDLRCKLQYLCDNFDDVYRLKKETAEYICNKYNWDDITVKTLELYGLKEVSYSETGAEEKEYENTAHK